MASINRIFNISKEIGAICGKMFSLQLRLQATTMPLLKKLSVGPLLQSTHKIHTTTQRLDIMEFFDDPKNWGKDDVKHGRAWSKDELRIKSNVDLHKLWYILLKERNMLLTMEYESNDKMKLFPSPERIDKVKLSMENLERVVQERNRAYHLLETGRDGERPRRMVWSQLGLRKHYRCTEHHIPAKYNKKPKFGFRGYAAQKFRKLYKEKYVYTRAQTQKTREHYQVKQILRRFPHVSRELLAQKYPNVKLGKVLAQVEGIRHIEPQPKPQ